MPDHELASALRRAETVLRRRPALGLHDDAPGTARWLGGTRVVASHPNGTEVQTDLSPEVGGSGDRVSPGWLLRAAMASCIATRIAMEAAAQGIELDALEVVAKSRSDTRGLLGMTDEHGAAIPAAPRDLELLVRVAAQSVAPERVHALVARAHASSPVSGAVQSVVPLDLHVEVNVV